MLGRVVTLLFLMLMLGTGAFSQSQNDSLRDELKNTTDKDLRYDIQSQIAANYYNQKSYDTSLIEHRKLWQMASSRHDTIKTEVLRRLGMVYKKLNDYQNQVQMELNRIKILEKDPERIAEVADITKDIGRIFYKDAQYDSAMHYYLKAEELFDDNNLDGHDRGMLYHYIGSVFKRQGDMVTACEYYYDMLDYGNEFDLAEIKLDALSLIGVCMDSPDEENRTNFEVIRLATELGYMSKVATTHNNIAATYTEMGMHDSAYYHIMLCLDYRKDNGSLSYLSHTYAHVGKILNDLGRYNEALKNFDLAEELALQDREKQDLRLMNVAEGRATAFAGMGNYKLAYEYQALYYHYRDSSRAAESAELVAEMELAYETQKKEDAISMLETENELKDEQRKAADQRAADEEAAKQLYLIIGIVFLIIGAIAVFKFLESQKRKKIIENQKMIVEQKNQEIIDSINYAKRIQFAILPPRKLVQENLPDSFIIYKPKDVVAGDFYWMDKIDDTLFLAAADCTGHGVPGAMVSVICNAGLNRSVKEFQLKDPGKILDKTRELVIAEFEKSEEEVKDGMDIALVSIQKQSGASESVNLNYAGAHNPLWIIRKDSEELEEIKADKQPIGVYAEESPFQSHTVELHKGDTFFIFSDGFADQFGGDKGKKMKASNLKQLVIQCREKSMSEQGEFLDNAFENWKRDLEQLDDVCMIGVRV